MKKVLFFICLFSTTYASQDNFEIFLHDNIDKISVEIIRKEIYPYFEYDDSYWYLTGKLDAYYEALNEYTKQLL